MKTAYIMRGVPGSGKSTIAKKLAGEKGVVHSTDSYFYIDGAYRHDASKLREYHKLNLGAFCASLKADIPIVICDNTNVKYWNFTQYVKAAHEAGYIVAYVTLPHPSPEVAAQRTIHNVPPDVIREMIRGWEN